MQLKPNSMSNFLLNSIRSSIMIQEDQKEYPANQDEGHWLFWWITVDPIE